MPVQPFTLPDDGGEALLITTGGQNSPGGLYLLPMVRLEQGRAEYTVVLREPYGRSGFMVPPVLSDVNGDGVEDMVLAGFNATVYALDGRSPFAVLWTHTFAASETVSSLVPGHYNNDNVTDFMCKYNTGPGFPVYYYSQVCKVFCIYTKSIHIYKRSLSLSLYIFYHIRPKSWMAAMVPPCSTAPFSMPAVRTACWAVCPSRRRLAAIISFTGRRNAATQHRPAMLTNLCRTVISCSSRERTRVGYDTTQLRRSICMCCRGTFSRRVQ